MMPRVTQAVLKAKSGYFDETTFKVVFIDVDHATLHKSYHYHSITLKNTFASSQTS